MPTREETTAAQEPMAFFSHDSNASQDVKCQRLIHRRGYDGYGRWWRLCEYLAASKSFVEELLDIGLLERDEDGFLTNFRMLKNALYFGRQRANGRKGGRPRKNPKNNDSAGQGV